MKYTDLLQFYFERSTALQLYWSIYVLIIGGLLAFSSLRQRKDLVTAILVTVLYGFFAYKNLGAIEDVTMERLAILAAIKEYTPAGPDAADVRRLREKLEPTLTPLEFEGVRNFHIASDLLTIAALWAMEWRRRRWELPAGTPVA
jgi:hypothetical protein